MTLRQIERPDGRIYYFAGASRSGKTFHAIDVAKRHKRLLVWDSKDEWSAHGCDRYDVDTAGKFYDICGRKTATQSALVVPTNDEWFNFFCENAIAWLTLHQGAIVVEELADVSRPNKAPDAWGKLLRTMKGFGAYVYVICQAPAEADKTALRNTDEIHCHALVRPDDQTYMSKYLGVSTDAVAALVPWQCLSKTELGRPATVTGKINPELRASQPESAISPVGPPVE